MAFGMVALTFSSSYVSNSSVEESVLEESVAPSATPALLYPRQSAVVLPMGPTSVHESPGSHVAPSAY